MDKEGDQDAVNVPWRCCICFEEVLRDRSYVDPCFHSFCLGCVRNWLRRSRSCPLCKCRIEVIVHNVWRRGEFYETLDPQEVLIQEEEGEEKQEDKVSGDDSATVAESVGSLFSRVRGISRRRLIYSMGFHCTSWCTVSYDSVQKSNTSGYILGLNHVDWQQKGGFATNKSASNNSITSPFYSRVLPFISRDLSVICDTEDVLIIREFLFSCLQSYDLGTKEGQRAIGELMEEFLFERSSHFVHELVCFIRSRLSMEVFDSEAKYIEVDS
eukprot:Nk52_evm4s382 gene=Nk52_evmTU4s382